MDALPDSKTAAELTRTRAIARLLDTMFTVPGTRFRFGIDPLLGLVPGAGDIVGGLLSSYIVAAAVRARAPRTVLLRMLANMGIDMLLSAVPLVGDLFDMGWKSNVRNLQLLQDHLGDPRKTEAASRGFILALGIAVGTLVLATLALSFLALRWILGLIGEIGL